MITLDRSKLALALSVLLATATTGLGQGTVVSGNGQSATGSDSVIVGGGFNTATGDITAIISGAQNTATGKDSVVIAGFQQLNAGFDAVIASGEQNEIKSGGNRGVILSGSRNTIQAGSRNSFIGVGADNSNSGNRSAIVVGSNNNVNSSGATDSAILCGTSNLLAGTASAVLCGTANNAGAGANFSALGGRNATTNHVGTFVWNSTASPFASTADGQFLINVDDGVGVNVADPSAPLHVDGGAPMTAVGGGDLWIGDAADHLALSRNQIQGQGSDTRVCINFNGGDVCIATGPTAGDVDLGNAAAASTVTVFGTFVDSSDRNLKEDFREVDPDQILKRLASMPISSWKFRGSSERRHVGPMAQDFHAAFDDLLDLQSDDTTIAAHDRSGVAFGAIKALHSQIQAKDAEIDSLLEREERKAEKIENLELRLERLEQLLEKAAE